MERAEVESSEEIEKEEHGDREAAKEQPWREEKNFNCQGNPKRASRREYGYIAREHHKVEVEPAVRYRAGNQTAW